MNRISEDEQGSIICWSCFDVWYKYNHFILYCDYIHDKHRSTINFICSFPITFYPI